MIHKFHSSHGRNIELRDNNTVAIRGPSIGYAVVFSEKQLSPGELFVVEVDENDRGWCGYLRLGLTELNPSTLIDTDFELPMFPVPDMSDIAATWMYPLSELRPDIESGCDLSWPFDIDPEKIHLSEEFIKTCKGVYPRVNLRHVPLLSNERPQEVDVGHRIGITYIPVDENVAELYFILDANVYGPYAQNLPYRKKPLYVILDLYGKTKKVRLVQIPAEKSLKQMCRQVIVEALDVDAIDYLSLPKSIKDYLQFKTTAS